MQIVEYDEIREQLEKVKEACDFLPDTTTEEAYGKSKRVSLDVDKLLTALEKKRKDKKAYFLEGGRQVDAQAKSIAEELEQYQKPHKQAYKALDNAIKELEANRKAELEQRVQQMRTLPYDMRDSDSRGLLLAMESMQSEECLGFYEYTMQALEARNSARAALGAMYADTLKAETEAVELAKLRAEKEARDKSDYEDKIRREASAKAELEKAEAIKREEIAKQALIESEAKAVEAQKQSIRYAEEMAEKARLAEIARQAEAKRIEDSETARREADKNHKASINNAAVAAIMSECGITEETAKSIVIAIAKGKIPSVKISY